MQVSGHTQAQENKDLTTKKSLSKSEIDYWGHIGGIAATPRPSLWDAADETIR
jgi:hypothetical protein